MKKFWTGKLNLGLSKGSLEKVFNPFVFWKVTVVLFFGSLVLVAVSHTLLFYWFESRAEKEIEIQATESFFDRDKLSRVYRRIKLKEENFTKYFDEKPEISL